MNAILRESEAAVLTNEALEVHLSYLRQAIDALAERIDKTNEKLEQTTGRISERLEQTTGRISERLEQTTARISERLEQTNDRISKVQGSIEGLKWFVASIAVILSGLSIAHTLGWI